MEEFFVPFPITLESLEEFIDEKKAEAYERKLREAAELLRSVD